MIVYDNNKEYRNLQEQVEKNKDDILEIKQGLGGALPSPIAGPQGPIGATGPQGVQGVRGNSLFTCGATLPSAGSYLTNDLILVTAGVNKGNIYKKLEGKWNGPICNINGPEGPIGPVSVEVVANPTGTATEDLVKIKIDGVIYNIPGVDYVAGTGITINEDTISVDETVIQHKLTAGDNITITDNVISATGGGTEYTAGNGIDITDNEISVDTDTISTVDYVDESVTGLITESEAEDIVDDKLTAYRTSANQDIIDTNLNTAITNETTRATAQENQIRALATGKCKVYVISYTDTYNESYVGRYIDKDGNTLTQAQIEAFIENKELKNTNFNSQNDYIGLPNYSGYYFILRKGLQFILIASDDWSDLFKPGDEVFVIETNVPDRWFDNGYLYALETKSTQYSAGWGITLTQGNISVNNTQVASQTNLQQGLATRQPLGDYATLVNNKVPVANMPYTSGVGIQITNDVISNDGVNYQTDAPTASNPNGLKVVVLDSEPSTKYTGYIYMIKESA